MNKQPHTSIAYLNTPATRTTRTHSSIDAMDHANSKAALGRQDVTQTHQPHQSQGFAAPSTSNLMRPTNPDFDQQQEKSLSAVFRVGKSGSGATLAPLETASKASGKPLHRAKQASHSKPKAVRACNHCQRSHLTCNNSRPCARCIKRGLAESCVDGTRKRAKYMLDGKEDQDDDGKEQDSYHHPARKAMTASTKTVIAANAPQSHGDAPLQLAPLCES
ncbi:Transcriptional regulator of nonfermentable carbon utilization, partial [Coemansia aciculifera]